MLTDVLLPWLSWLDLKEITVDEYGLTLTLTATQPERCCPLCQQGSRAIHSWYRRTVADLPWAGRRVVLALCVRKFFCRALTCLRKVFCERLTPLAPAYARRTQRLYQEQQKLGLDLGAAVGVRTAQRQGMTVSATTMLRQVRQTSLPTPATPRKLGIDDWALCKGKRYGTLLVDLEQHKPVELLPDRTAATLARWLQAHPEVEIITRDRANDYIEGASQGAPQARQVADRFHLLQNVRELLQRLLERHQAALRAVATIAAPPPAGEGSPTAAPANAAQPPLPVLTVASPLAVKETKAEQERAAHRTQRLARYQQVRALHASGLSQRAIVRQLGLSKDTVRSFLRADQFPERATRRRIASKLDPFLPYLRQQLASGQDNALQLWRDLRDQQGYSGSHGLVSRWVAQHRHLCPLPSPTTPKPKRCGKPPLVVHKTPGQPPSRILSARQAAWLLFRAPEELDEAELHCQQRLCQQAAPLQTAYHLLHEFMSMVRQRCADRFDDWLAQAEATQILELQAFVVGLRRDYAAVKAALTLPESNGQTEGQVNRLKFIKRSMYGRAKFDLLRLRVLAA